MTLLQPAVILRADASKPMGMGHIMRYLSLAEAWQDSGGLPIFATTMQGEQADSFFKQQGIEAVKLSVVPGSPEDAEQTAKLAHERNVQWIVVDGYQFNSTYQKILKKEELSILLIDDIADGQHYYADLVLNTGISAQENLYPDRETGTRLLLGPRYVLLRREFLKHKRPERKIENPLNKIFVTLGGSAPENIILKVIEGLRQLKNPALQVKVLAGQLNTNLANIVHAIQRAGNHFEIVSAGTPVSELMAWCEVAVSGAGITIWELAFMGVPSVLLVLADNQRSNAQNLGDLNAAVNLGWHGDLQPVKIAQAVEGLLGEQGGAFRLSQKARQLVDGEGVSRVLMILQNRKLRLRKAEEKDDKILWEWANDPEVRQNSFSSADIPWESHLAWIEKTLKDLSCHLFIAVDQNDGPIGSVRFNLLEDQKAQVHISLAKSHRGLGRGSMLLTMAANEFFKYYPAHAIHALVKPANKASLKTFEKAGFQNFGMVLSHGQEALLFIRKLS